MPPSDAMATVITMLLKLFPFPLLQVTLVMSQVRFSVYYVLIVGVVVMMTNNGNLAELTFMLTRIIKYFSELPQNWQSIWT